MTFPLTFITIIFFYPFNLPILLCPCSLFIVHSSTTSKTRPRQPQQQAPTPLPSSCLSLLSSPPNDHFPRTTTTFHPSTTSEMRQLLVVQISSRILFLSATMSPSVWKLGSHTPSRCSSMHSRNSCEGVQGRECWREGRGGARRGEGRGAGESEAAKGKGSRERGKGRNREGRMGEVEGGARGRCGGGRREKERG